MVGPNVVAKGEEDSIFEQSTDSPFIIEYFDDKRVQMLVDALNR
jgi:hypothetical protein